jgi:hypothetical protein
MSFADLVPQSAGTSVETFEGFIKELDDGAGESSIYDPTIIPYQSYLTMLKPSQVEGLEQKYKFLLLVHRCVFDPADLDASEEFLSIPSGDYKGLTASNKNSRPTMQSLNSTSFAKEILNSPRALSEPDKDAPYWKKMISSPFVNPPQSPAQDPPFVADDAGGRGSTIYIIDDGFDTGFEVSLFLFRPHSDVVVRRVVHYCVSGHIQIERMVYRRLA